MAHKDKLLTYGCDAEINITRDQWEYGEHIKLESPVLLRDNRLSWDNIKDKNDKFSTTESLTFLGYK